MSVICPHGHESATTDYCDQCGAPIDGPPPEARASLPPDGLSAGVQLPPSPTLAPLPAAPGEPCPVCKAARAGDDQFCEGCGYDFVSGVGPARVLPPTPPVSHHWELVVAADRSYYERLAPAGVPFPSDYPPRTIALEAEEIQIGRHGQARGVRLEIDLSGAAEDPGISRLHAALVRADDGCYALVDRGSTNGTTLNDDLTPIAANIPIPLHDGDRIHLGAWTTVTIRSVSKSGGHAHP